MGKAPNRCPMCQASAEWIEIDTTRKGWNTVATSIGFCFLGPLALIFFGPIGKKKVTYACKKCLFKHEYDKEKSNNAASLGTATANNTVKKIENTETYEVAVLKKLKELLDNGVITQEQFDEKKREIMRS